MVRQSIVKALVKSFTHFSLLFINFFSLLLSFYSTLKSCPTQKLTENNVLVKKLLNEVLEYHCTYKSKKYNQNLCSKAKKMADMFLYINF